MGGFKEVEYNMDNGTKEVSWRPGVLRGVGRECVGEQWTKWRVELLRLLSSWAIWRLSCEALRGGSPCVCFVSLSAAFVCALRGMALRGVGLPRHRLPRRGLARHGLARHGVFRDVGLTRHGLARLGGEDHWLPGSALARWWSGSGGPVDVSQSHPLVSNSVLPNVLSFIPCMFMFDAAVCKMP
jgi:hypothetical protein